MDPLPGWGTLPRMLAAQAATRPDTVVVVEGRIRLTTIDLLRRSRAVTRTLIGLGIEPGDRVAIWAPNSWQWVVTAFGVWQAGAIVVPLSTRYRAIEAGEMLVKTGARVLFSSGQFLGLDYVGMLTAEFGPAEAGRPFQGLTELRELLLLDNLPADLPTTVSAEEVEARAMAVRPNDVCSILATSGTTGEPKGVMLTGEQVMRTYWDWSQIVDLREGDRYPIVSPFAHGFGINAGLIACVMRAAEMYPIAIFDPDSALELVARERVTLLAGPPALFERLLSRSDLADHDISTLRVAVVGAAAVPTELIRRMRSDLGIERVVNAYGLMEGSVVSATRADDPIEVMARTAGRVVPDMRVLIVDDDGRPVPTGERGEILVAGYGLMVGYWEAAELTREAIDVEGWLHTGDIGAFDEQGNLSIIDRKKEMFVVSGFNAYPAEIERLLGRHPGIAAVAVVGMPDPTTGEVGCACVVANPNATLTAEEVIAWAREKMSNYKVPRRVRIVDALPLNANGKVDKRALRGKWEALSG
jgi:HIP---CoA ligase